VRFPWPARSRCANCRAVPLALQRKFSHLAVFARSLLPPEGGASPALPAAAAALLADNSFDGSRPTLALRAVRAAARAEHAWCENQGVPPHKFAVGDLGHVPRGAALGERFVKLCNVFGLEQGQAVPAAAFPVVKEQDAYMWCWKDAFNKRQDVQGFPMGPDIFGCVSWSPMRAAAEKAQVARRSQPDPENGRSSHACRARGRPRRRVGVLDRARQGARRALRRPGRRARPQYASTASSPMRPRG
jgi:hypothetical protein